MENQTANSQFKEFFRRNGSYIFFFGGAGILLLIIFSIVIISSKRPTQKVTVTAPTPILTSGDQQRSISPTAIPNTTFSPQEQTVLENQTVPQIQQKTPASFTVTKVHPYSEDWAIMEISAQDTDNAHVIVKKENGTWTVVLGPGTYFDSSQLQAIGAPQSLIDQVNAQQ